MVNQDQICPICRKGSIGGITHPGCRRSLGLDGLTAVFAYQGIIKKAIKKLKYRFVTDLASELVELFLSFVGENDAFIAFCQKEVLLLPIPLHPSRYYWRGFNQTELLGKLIADNLGINFAPDVLIRRKKTQSQVALKPQERVRNIKNAFSFNRNTNWKIKNRKILLFDDVWTTGATLKEAGKVLKRKGALAVWGVALAR